MNARSNHHYPAEFAWGAATAAYQIEGAAAVDGRGESVWDRFCATPGKVRNGDSGAIACDFYHRYREDVALMRELGLKAFRFSISWPRILPAGDGTVNPAGLDFYDRLVDELLAADITPFVTLYHWDLPQALEDRGGWPRRATIDAFTEYVEVVAKRLADRVDHWITHNEPRVNAWVGYGWGTHAPGRTSEPDALAAAHHLLVSHGRAVEILRREAPDAQVGITLDLFPVYPASGDECDRDAARHFDGFHNRWFLDPVFRGEYPADLLEHFGANAPPVQDGDLAVINTPIDFLGVNYYRREVVAGSENGRPQIVHQPDSVYTDMGWEVSPEGLFDLLVRLRDDYGTQAIYVTENGAAFSDVRIHDGSVRDPERQAYLEEHIGVIDRALAAGVPVAGYFVWSFLDNFEWTYGYSKRFGLVYVDYPTLERIPKSSFYWYRDFIAATSGSATKLATAP
ncbi:MAG: GH1 family beta-glucosidase [Gaiellaceae bacterium]